MWLARMGFDINELDAQDLQGYLLSFTTIVVGVFTFGLRQDLAAAQEKLHHFVEPGGYLVALYHRPVDNWIADRTPVRYLEIGTFSLRWRVNDPQAPFIFCSLNIFCCANQI